MALLWRHKIGIGLDTKKGNYADTSPIFLFFSQNGERKGLVSTKCPRHASFFLFFLFLFPFSATRGEPRGRRRARWRAPGGGSGRGARRTESFGKGWRVGWHDRPREGRGWGEGAGRARVGLGCPPAASVDPLATTKPRRQVFRPWTVPLQPHHHRSAGNL